MNKEIYQSKDDLTKHLEEQISFLKKSSESFDNGYESEAKRLAVTLRILLHDTNKSISLLSQLNKKNILFYDTATDYYPKSLNSYLGLIMTGFTFEEGKRTVKFVAPLDRGLSPSRYKGKIPFDNWWNKIVFVDNNKDTLTRKELVLSVSDKDGGAHIDPKLDKIYANISRFDSLKWQELTQSIVTGAELASIRQIAYEVLKSLKDEFTEYF